MGNLFKFSVSGEWSLLLFDYAVAEGCFGD